MRLRFCETGLTILSPFKRVVSDCLEFLERLFPILSRIVHGFDRIEQRSREKSSNPVNFSVQDNVEPLVDPFCVEENPQKITFEDITSAAFKIKCGVVNTPCVRSRLSEMTGIDLYLKKDFLQLTGSFKERGARYALVMLSDEQKKIGVISASLGNHALALSYHGYKLGISVTVVMPVVAPIMKITACRQYGATVIVDGRDMGEAKRIAFQCAKDKGLTYINGYDHPDIMAGQGTLGLEIVEQVPNIDAVVVPVGGGGLIAGVALAVKTLHPNVTIIGVESERCSSFHAARKADRPIYTPIESTLADGLAVPMVGYNAFATANPLIDKLVVVKEEWIAIAILKLVENEKCIVEGAGATGLAAILAGQLDELKGKRVVLPLCGGNIDTTILGRCLERGLAAEGRLLKFTVTVSDRPGGISELCKMLASIGVSIKDIMHERAWIMSDIFSVDVKVVCETRDKDHAEQLKDMLYQNYQRVVFGTSNMSSLNV
ncbi:L-threonine ammonia-lyase isoform X2 [Hylaeus volcanicus]|uniref:L-threonine ammonia-lyase isoform X2 n=1 Tax=Hylaeus volcanicus TaxID=313075 RepID=UPI0023B7A1C3|nr:L-threonine ammonia-lyase isoform X2 [Hylaeus volcanicus]